MPEANLHKYSAKFPLPKKNVIFLKSVSFPLTLAGLEL